MVRRADLRNKHFFDDKTSELTRFRVEVESGLTHVRDTKTRGLPDTRGVVFLAATLLDDVNVDATSDILLTYRQYDNTIIRDSL